jgi:hypothetical protein
MCRPLAGFVLLVLSVASATTPLVAQQSSFLGKPAARWVEELNSRDPRVRRGAAFALGKAGGEALSAVPRLVRVLKDSAAPVREAAAYALGEIGSSSWKETFPALIPLATGDPDPMVRRSVAFALGRLGRQLPADSEETVARRWKKPWRIATPRCASMRPGQWANSVRNGPARA